MPFVEEQEYLRRWGEKMLAGIVQEWVIIRDTPPAQLAERLRGREAFIREVKRTAGLQPSMTAHDDGSGTLRDREAKVARK